MPAGQSNGSNGSNGLRVLVASVGTALFILAAPLWLAALPAGCGSSDDSSAAPPSKPPPPADATIPLVMVVTGGGGGPSADGSSSSGGFSNPFGDLPDGSSSGGGPPDGSVALNDGSNMADVELPDTGPPPPFCPATYVPIPCGANPGDTCDLRLNTCCVTLDLQETCVPLSTQCNTMQASVHCENACDCSGGQVCCGVVNELVGVAQTVCQSVSDGGLCQPSPATNTQAAAQVCTVDAECKNGEPCIFQTCQFGAMFHLCGLQSGDPFDCTANQ